jgi:hypothetical protein
MSAFDSVSAIAIQKANQALEEKLDTHITENNRSLHVPLPVAREKHTCVA